VTGDDREQAADAATARPPLRLLFRQLGDDATAFAKAQAAFYKAVATDKAIGAAWVAGLVIAALTLLQGALVATLVGLILALSPVIGIGWSIAAVAFGAIMFSAFLAVLAARKARTLGSPKP
jgi:hypothetical protein